MRSSIARFCKAFTSDWLVLALLCLSLAGNVYLGLRALRCTAVADGRQERLEVGSLVERVEAVDREGRRQSVALVSSPLPTVLFVYSESCPWCKRTWPLFRQVAQAQKARFRFVTLCLGNTPLFADESVLALARPSASTLGALRVGAVPETVVVGVDGRVSQAWVGAYTGSREAAIAAFFGVAFSQTGQ